MLSSSNITRFLKRSGLTGNICSTGIWLTKTNYLLLKTMFPLCKILNMISEEINLKMVSSDSDLQLWKDVNKLKKKKILFSMKLILEAQLKKLSDKWNVWTYNAYKPIKNISGSKLISTVIVSSIKS